MSAPFDLVIRGGTIFDGTGGAPFESDVGVLDGRIAAVAKGLDKGAQEVEAAGLMVTPGFVDVHTHYDGQVTWDSRLAPSSQHGVTTVLMGNCGVGFAPCRPADRETLVRVMEGVEDIPQTVMAEGLPWTWETFPEYLDVLARRTSDIDFATQAPHAPIRVHVMGARGAAREPATDAELGEMTRLVAEAVAAGAFGVSTSRSFAHRTRDGALAPMVMAEERELLALAEGLRQAGRGIFQLIPEAHAGDDPVAEMALIRRIVEASGRPLSFSLLNTVQQPEAARARLAMLEAARADGLPIRAQVYPRPVGVLFGLELSFHPFRFHPSYQAIEHLPLAERVERMRRPEVRAQILSERAEHSNEVFLYLAGQAAELFPLGDPPNYEPDPSERLGVRAAALGVTPEALAYDLLLEQEGCATLLLPSANYVGYSLEPVRELMAHEGSVIALGDGGAHYGMICDSSYPTTLLSYWCRDRVRGERFSLPWAVKSLSRDPAELAGFVDRGSVAVGMKADLNVIDFDRLRLHPPRSVADLPAGGRRLLQRADGYRATVVSGTITYRDGEATGALPGRLLRSGAS